MRGGQDFYVSNPTEEPIQVAAPCGRVVLAAKAGLSGRRQHTPEHPIEPFPAEWRSYFEEAGLKVHMVADVGTRDLRTLDADAEVEAPAPAAEVASIEDAWRAFYAETFPRRNLEKNAAKIAASLEAAREESEDADTIAELADADLRPNWIGWLKEWDK